MRRVAETGRRREAPRRGRRPVRAAVAATLAAVALGGPVWLWKSGLADDYAARARAEAGAALADLGFRVREIRIAGNRRIAREAVLAAAGLRLGASIFEFDPAHVRDRLEAVPWIGRASVSRVLPDTAAIRIEERRPFALWQRGGRLALIDRAGGVITAHALHRFAELPMIVAPAAPVAAGGLFETLAAEPDLGRRVRTAVRVGGRRWDVRLDNGIDVRLPEAGEGRAWRRLAQLERRHALLARRIEAIDLRFPDRVVVRRADAKGETGKGRE